MNEPFDEQTMLGPVSALETEAGVGGNPMAGEETGLSAFHRAAAGPGSLRIEVAGSLPPLARYESAWNRLAFGAPQQLATLSYAWVVTHLENAPDQPWRCALAFEGEELVGVLPAIIEPWSFAGLTRPRLSAPWKKNITSVDFLVAEGREGTIIPLLFKALTREYPKFYDFALRELPETSPTLSILGARLKSHVVAREPAGTVTYIKVEKGFGEYKARLDARFKKNLVKARRRLTEMPGVNTVILTGKEATERELDRFLELEASGWKGKAGSAILKRPGLAEFNRGLVRRLSGLGWLEWYFLVADDRTLAAQLGIKLKRTLMLLYTAYDEAFARCAPGNLLQESIVQHAFDRGDIEEINCFSDYPWQENWAVEKRPCYNLQVYPYRLLPLVSGLLPKKMRPRLQRVPGLRALYRRLRFTVR